MASLPAHEGLRLDAYQDTGGVWTICYGHTATAKPGMQVTQEECDRLLEQDVAAFEFSVRQMVKVGMTEPQAAAITSFCYNVGESACRKSTLIKKINAGDLKSCDQILRWVYVDGKDCRDPKNNCRGIVERRQAEAALCQM